MTKQTEKRPPLASLTSAAELRRWYWTKAELLDEVRRRGLRTAGGKFTLLDRIAHHLETGETAFPSDVKPKITSKFDWHSEPLGRETRITDSYKNSQNVRLFFKSEIGPQFKFNIAFMDWIKANVGRTLAEAADVYREMEAAARSPEHQSEIASHNQFNQYTRDFLADNPTLGMKDVRHFWALKRALPSQDGRHRYAPQDLALKE